MSALPEFPDASRAAFEAWSRSKNMAMTMSEGTLEDCAATLLAWNAWQASRKQVLEEAAKVCDFNAKNTAPRYGVGIQLINHCAKVIRSLK